MRTFQKSVFKAAACVKNIKNIVNCFVANIYSTLIQIS